MFYLLPNMPPIMENTAEDEVTIAMVEFEKKRSLQRYSRYGSTVSQNDAENNKLASTLLKTVDNNISGNESNSDYNNLANKMVCAKRIQYAAGFITIISIIIVLILTTINSGDEPNLAPHSPQHGHSSKSSPSSLGFDAATGDIIYDNIDINEEKENIIDDEPQVIDDKENIIDDEDKIIDQEKEQNEENEFDNAVFGIDNINAMKDVDYNENENNLNDDNDNNNDDNEIENNNLNENENDNTNENKNENNIDQNDDELNNIVENGNDEQGAEQADKQSVAQANEEADEADDDDGELGDDYGFIADRYDEGMDDDRSS